jgi:hypothetical protein
VNTHKRSIVIQRLTSVVCVEGSNGAASRL